MENAELSFTVRMATTLEDLRAICAVRQAAYSHHDTEVGLKFGEIEPLDYAEGTAVLLCRDKISDAGVGTVRVQISGFGPLQLEQSIVLPDWLTHKPRAHISRLAVLAGADPRIKLSLMKACYQYCLATRVRWMVIGARNPALIRNYRSLGFVDVFEAGRWLPLASGGGLPHQILALDVAGAESNWRATRNRLYGFMSSASRDGLHAV
ncbi:MAG: hypothetical protein ABIN37_04750, partial [Burkholderiaceae bacterium]